MFKFHDLQNLPMLCFVCFFDRMNFEMRNYVILAEKYHPHLSPPDDTNLDKQNCTHQISLLSVKQDLKSQVVHIKIEDLSQSASPLCQGGSGLAVLSC